VSASEAVHPLKSESSTATAPDDILEALRVADVWELFCTLPRANQEEFGRWIEHSPDQSARWRRIDALTLALQMSPLMERGAPPHA
jgi:ferric-dicitrate binding protein FerR (iron transport regulator)